MDRVDAREITTFWICFRKTKYLHNIFNMYQDFFNNGKPLVKSSTKKKVENEENEISKIGL